MAAQINFQDALEFLAITNNTKANAWIADNVPADPNADPNGVRPSPSQMKDVILRRIAEALGVEAPTVNIADCKGHYSVVDWPAHRQRLMRAFQTIHDTNMKQHALMATPAPGAVVPTAGGSRSVEQAALDAAAADAAEDVAQSGDRAVNSRLGHAAAAAAREKHAVKQTIDTSIAAARVHKSIMTDEGGAVANAAPGIAAAAADAPPSGGAVDTGDSGNTVIGGGADGGTVDTTNAAPAGGTATDTDDGGDPVGAGAAGIVKK